MHAIQHFPHGKGLKVGPEIFRAIPADLADDFHPRVIFLQIDADIGIVLIIPQEDIIVGLIFP